MATQQTLLPPARRSTTPPHQPAPTSSPSSTSLFDVNLLRAYPFTSSQHLPPLERAQVSYDRAKAIALCAGLELEDIAFLRQKFWDLHVHPVMAWDGAATTLLTIQYNLVIGTLSQYAPRQPDLLPLMNDLLKYRKIGQFLLTERGHGLDAENLETTATLLPSGEFILHSPSEPAAKYMPPTAPMGIPTIGLVFARLIVNGVSHGIRPFLVDLNDGVNMSPGVSAKLLPTRGGTNPVNHSLTSFNHVRLPRTALLGSLKKSKNPNMDFRLAIWRVAVGSLALGTMGTCTLEVYSTIGLQYSLRRTVAGSKGGPPVPIFAFRTQQIPVLVTTAQTYVMRALSRWATAFFSDMDVDPRVRHGVAACVKATITQHAQAASIAVSDRCGAQGLFEVNQMSNLFSEMRGIAIAEGDILALSIRLATEIILGRYEMPAPLYPDSLLARHEAGIQAELTEVILSVTNHRASEVNRRILPRAQAFVEAIGHRMAYDAARAAGVMPALLDLYVASVVKLDPSWYAEEAGLGRRAQMEMEERALDAVLPHVERLVDELGVKPYVTAPIMSDEAWDGFVQGLRTFEGPPAGSVVGVAKEEGAGMGRVSARL